MNNREHKPNNNSQPNKVSGQKLTLEINEESNNQTDTELELETYKNYNKTIVQNALQVREIAKKVNAKNRALKEQLEKAINENTFLEYDKEQAVLENTRLENQVKKIQEENIRLKSELEKATSSNTYLKESMLSVNNTNTKLLQENEFIQKENTRLSKEQNLLNESYTTRGNELDIAKLKITSLERDNAESKKTTLNLSEDINSLSSNNQIIKSSLNQANIQIEKITTNLNKAYDDNKELATEIITTKIENKNYQSENKRYHDRERQDLIEKNTSKMKDQLSHFVKAYITENINYSADYYCFTMFSRHGSTGRTEATLFKMDFDTNKVSVNSKEDLLEYLKLLINKNNLSGNYHSGSFKTYLLAYHDYVHQLNLEQELPDLNVEYYMQNYVARNNNVVIKQRYIRTFQNNQNLINNLKQVV